jgi:hypothetical protein
VVKNAKNAHKFAKNVQKSAKNVRKSEKKGQKMSRILGAVVNGKRKS